VYAAGRAIGLTQCAVMQSCCSAGKGGIVVQLLGKRIALVASINAVLKVGACAAWTFFKSLFPLPVVVDEEPSFMYWPK
jgi:hypothetical protein